MCNQSLQYAHYVIRTFNMHSQNGLTFTGRRTARIVLYSQAKGQVYMQKHLEQELVDVFVNRACNAAHH